MKKTKLTSKLVLLATVCAIVLGMYLLNLPCPFRAVFGIDCPGCGITRAWISVLKGDFGNAFALHPLFWAVPLWGLYWWMDWRVFHRKWVDESILMALTGGFLVNWLIKLIS